MLATALPHEFERAAAAGAESPNVSQLITTDCVCHDTMRSAAPSIVLFQTSDREKLIKFHPELVQRSIRRDLKRPLQGHGRVILEQTAESARSHTNLFRQCELPQLRWLSWSPRTWTMFQGPLQEIKQAVHQLQERTKSMWTRVETFSATS